MRLSGANQLRHIARQTAALCWLVAAADAGPLPAPLTETDFPAQDPAEVALGRLLFYDPILSGNRNISCATCHHPRFATGDGVSLGLGEGGIGLGPDRRADPANAPEQRIPRNAPPLFNLGHADIRVLFHDGRIEVDKARPSGLRTPMGAEMEAGFSGILSAQTMFPVLSADEMAGHYGENDVAKAVRSGRITGEGGAWHIISRRVSAVPDYAEMFAAARPRIAEGRPIAFTDISDVIAAFMAEEWRADTTPFDAHLRGEGDLPPAAARGMALFYGDAGCDTCHSGPLLSDQAFHAMGQPQLGPGKAARFEDHARDDGRMRVTGRAEDAYAFRTPMLRNVMRTGPWGHAGAFDDMTAFLRHHTDPASGLSRYTQSAILPEIDNADDWIVMSDAAQVSQIAAKVTRPATTLTERQIADLIAFLDTLTDPISLTGRTSVPETVPSGLPVDR